MPRDGLRGVGVFPLVRCPGQGVPARAPLPEWAVSVRQHYRFVRSANTPTFSCCSFLFFVVFLRKKAKAGGVGRCFRLRASHLLFGFLIRVLSC